MLRQLDYQTLLFFIGLFVVVGGLEQTGILSLIAGFIAKVSGDNLMVMVAIVLWISAIASAFVDNIPFAATMIPVIQSLAESQGVSLSILAWALALGTDIGGSATPNSCEVMNIIGDVRGKDCIIFDDMIDTAGSLCNACKALREVGGAGKLYGCASHGVLSGPALQRIEDSYFEEIRILDTIPMPKGYTGEKIKQLTVADMFAEAITRIDEETSISSLF